MFYSGVLRNILSKPNFIYKLGWFKIGLQNIVYMLIYIQINKFASYCKGFYEKTKRFKSPFSWWRRRDW